MFVELSPFHIRRFRGHCRFQGTDIANAVIRLDRLTAIVEQQEMLYPASLHRRRLRQRQQVRADQQDPGFGLGQHRPDILGSQARIERMAHCAHADNPVPAFKMALTVPGERRDPVALAHAKPMQGGRRRARAIVKRGIADPLDRSVRRCRHHLREGVPFCSVGKKLVESQCIILHRTVDHWQPSALGGSGGEMIPTFQFHGILPVARRRHTTASCSAAMPGKRLCPTRGSAPKCMKALSCA